MVATAEAEPPERVVNLAGGDGVTANGVQVGMIVWGTKEDVSSLEVFDYETESGEYGLPVVSSIR